MHLAAALRYVAAGFAVLPVWWPVDGHCACGKPCASPAKHPIAAAVPHGLKDASTDVATVTAWWTKWPNAGVAIRTGSEWGVWVLDVDPKGLGAWGALQEEYGHVSTLLATTGRGGAHAVFTTPAGVTIGNTANKIAEGIDTRGEGGYVLVEPSSNMAGAYVWQDFDLLNDEMRPLIEAAPAWLLARAIEVAPRKGGSTGEALNGALAGVGEGERNVAAARVCGTLFARGLDFDLAWMAIEGWNARNRPPMDEEELRKVASSMWRRDNLNHPERAAERAELATIEARIAAEEKRLGPPPVDHDAELDRYRQQSVQRQKSHELDMARAEEGLDRSAKEPGTALADPEARRRHLACLRGWLGGCPIDRWLRSGKVGAQYLMVIDTGERISIGDVRAVRSAKLFEDVLYERFGLELPNTTRKAWGKVTNSLHAILEVEDDGFSEADEIAESIVRYASETNAFALDETEALAEKRRTNAIANGRPFVDADWIYVQTGGLRSWLAERGDRKTSEDVRRLLRLIGARSDKLRARTGGGQRGQRHYWKVPRSDE